MITLRVITLANTYLVNKKGLKIKTFLFSAEVNSFMSSSFSICAGLFCNHSNNIHYPV